MRRNRLRVAAIGAVSLGLAGCFWPAPGAGPGRTAYNSFETEITPATVPALALEWTATGDGGAMGPPITSLRGVHASDPVGVYAFSFDTGARLWTQPVPPTAPFVVGPVVADGDRVVLGYGFGNLGGNWITSVRDAEKVRAPRRRTRRSRRRSTRMSWRKSSATSATRRDGEGLRGLLRRGYRRTVNASGALRRPRPSRTRSFAE